MIVRTLHFSTTYIMIVDLGGGKVQKTLQTYDGNGNVLTRSVYEGASTSAAAGNVWRYAYDGNNNVVRTTDPLGGVESFTYNAQNRQTSHTDRLGNVTRYVYQNSLLTQVVDALNQPTVFTYKPGSIKGLVETITDIYGAVTSYEYDNQGQLTRVTDARDTLRSKIPFPGCAAVPPEEVTGPSA